MAGTVDEKFVSRLDDFTRSLEGMVELLKEETKKRNVDPVNMMLANMNEDLHRIVEDMQKVVSTTDRIEANTKEILEQLKANKENKEKTRGFGEIAEVDNKQKIIDAIKIIGLITVGIVAVGMALKIVSPVSMLAAIGIGMSIVMITGAFVVAHKMLGDINQKRMFDISKMMLIISAALLATSLILSFAPTISFAKAVSLVFVATAMGTSLVLITKAIENSKIKPEYYGKMMMLPIILPIIALGIVISSFILSKITPLTMGQAITTLLVAGAMGVSLFLISKSMEKTNIGPGDVFKFLLLPVIVPVLAFAIVAASFIFSGIKVLTVGQVLSAIFVAGAIGVLIFLLKPAIAKMKDFSLKEILGVMGLVVALSVGLVLSSIILSKMHLFTVGQAFRMVLTSMAIGLSILFLVPSIYVLKSIKSEDMFKAAGNIIILAGTIAISSILLSFGDYSYAPDWKWSIGVGLTIIAFAGAIWAINKIGMSTKEMLSAGLSLLIISATISLVSQIISFGDYSNYPGLGWSIGVGLSLVAFGAGMMVLGLMMQTGIGASSIAIGALATLGVALTISVVSIILGFGEYNKYPTIEWSMGVGISMIAFGSAMAVLGILMTSGLAGPMAIGALATLMVAMSITAVSWILGTGDYTSYPTLNWSLGVGLSMIGFGTAMVALGILMMTGIGAGAMALGALATLLVASSIVAVSFILGTGVYNKYPTLEWSMGVGMSLVAFGGAMLITGIALPLLWLGSFSLKLIASTIKEVSEILSQGNYINGPSKSWAEGVSDLISTFSSAAISLSFTPFLFSGLDKIMSVAQAITDISNVLGNGNYTGGPTKAWAEGVGLSIKSFAEGISAMQETDSFFSFFGENQGQKIMNIAQSMMIANQMLSSESWTENYPTKAWAEGVGLSIKAFAEGLSALQETDTILESIFGTNQSEKIITLSTAMIEANGLLGSVSWSDNYPSKEWAEGVGAAIYAFAKPLAEMSAADMSTRDITKGIRRLSLGIVEAAYILNLFDWNQIKSYPSLEWSQAVGSAINAFAKPLTEMSAADLSTRDISKGIKRLSWAMVDAAYILNLFDWGKVDNYPTEEWSRGVGMAIGTFTKYLIEIEKNDIGRGEIKNLNRVIEAMTSTAMKFAIYGKLGIWDNYPPESWSDAVGSAIDKFVGYLIDFKKYKVEEDDVDNLRSVINSMITSALIFTIFGDGIWKTYPSKEWSENVGNTIKIFSEAAKSLSKIDNLDGLDGLALAIISFSNKISTLSKNSTLYATGGTIDNFSKSINNLVQNLPSTNASEALDTFATALIKISSMGITSTNSIMMLSKSISGLGESLKELDLESVEKLSKLSSGFLILSLIDDRKLEDSIKKINASKDEIKSILSNQGKIIQSKTTVIEENVVKNSTADLNVPDENSKFFDEMLNVVRNIDRNIDTISKSSGGMSPDSDEDIDVSAPENANVSKNS